MTNAKEYGRALFLLSEEDGTTEALAEEIRLVKEILREHPRYEKLLDTPALSREEKLLLIDGAFSSLNENLVNLLKILCEKHSVYQFSRIAGAYADLYDEARGIERAEVLTALVGKTNRAAAMEIAAAQLKIRFIFHHRG